PRRWCAHACFVLCMQLSPPVPNGDSASIACVRHTLDGAVGAAVSRGNSRRHGVRRPHTLPEAAWTSRTYRSSHRRGRLRSARPSAHGETRSAIGDSRTARARPRRRL
ncbi:hypothetical protein B0H15DRAFT_853061, partial [Mycena belliarum]